MTKEQTRPAEQVAKVRVRIDGEEYTVRGQTSDAYMAELAGYVDARIDQVRRAHPNLPRHRTAILVALHLADEVFQLKKENSELFELLDEAR